ncbi:MAG: cysteine desulfurase [Bacilli bacterium]|nr:cysteine desulfurase [Bacilli bacterium]
MPDNRFIYLDNAASTTNDESVLDVFVDSTRNYFANPSSIHAEGQKGADMLQKAHRDLIKAMGLDGFEAILTSGATEANNLAIKGYCLKNRRRGNHIVTSAIEHPSVLETVKQMCEELGFEATYVLPNKDGIVTLESVQKAIRKDTILVSIMHVNNETGTVNPIQEIGKYLRQFPKIAFHVDGVQAFGKFRKKADISDVDMFSITGHKIHGLMGCGALIKRKNIGLMPLFSGGGQEGGYRSGTNDLAHAKAFIKTVDVAFKNRVQNFDNMMILANKLVSYLLEHKDLYEVNSVLPIVNPYIINFSTLTKKASVVVEALSNEGIMVSSVSACHSSKEKESYVVRAMGKSEQIARNTIRVSFDSENTLEDVEIFIETLDNIIKKIR